MVAPKFCKVKSNYEETMKELSIRHKTAAMAVGGFFGLSVALIGIAYTIGKEFFRPVDSQLPIILWGLILVLSFGAIFLKRMRYSVSRLHDISILRGASGMLKDMQSTTITLASIGGAIALIGFIVMIRTGSEYDMYRAGLVAIGLLLYSYPQKSAWLRVVNWLESKKTAR